MSGSGQNICRLFYVTDCLTGLKFLVDTGAQVSAILPTPVQHKHPQEGLGLQAVKNSTNATYGYQLLMLDLGLRRLFRWIFVIANIQTPILGADFLQHFGLLVDVRHTCLSDKVIKLKVQEILSASSSPSPFVLPKQSLMRLMTFFWNSLN